MSAFTRAVNYTYRATTALCLFSFSILWFARGPEPETLGFGFLGLFLVMLTWGYQKVA